MRLLGLLVALPLLACQPAPVALPDLDYDLAPLKLGVLSGAPPARVPVERIIASTQADYPDGSITPLRLGRRWAGGFGTSAWVFVYRPPAGSGWAARVIDDQNGTVLLTFDEGSLRAFGVPLPEW